MWETDRDSGDDGFGGYRSVNEYQQSFPTVLTHCGVVPDLGDSLTSVLQSTLTLFLSSTTPSSVRLFPIPLALSC